MSQFQPSQIFNYDLSMTGVTGIHWVLETLWWVATVKDQTQLLQGLCQATPAAVIICLSGH